MKCYRIMVSRSVDLGDINPYLNTETIRQKIRDEYLRDSTATVVLVGAPDMAAEVCELGNWIEYTRHTVQLSFRAFRNFIAELSWLRHEHLQSAHNPPRLHKNIACDFATIHRWSDDPDQVQSWIHEVFLRRDRILPDNSYPSFKQNRTGERWYD